MIYHLQNILICSLLGDNSDAYQCSVCALEESLLKGKHTLQQILFPWVDHIIEHEKTLEEHEERFGKVEPRQAE